MRSSVRPSPIYTPIGPFLRPELLLNKPGPHLGVDIVVSESWSPQIVPYLENWKDDLVTGLSTVGLPVERAVRYTMPVDLASAEDHGDRGPVDCQSLTWDREKAPGAPAQFKNQNGIAV